MIIKDIYIEELNRLKEKSRERSLLNIYRRNNYVVSQDSNMNMCNISGNDYLGIGARGDFLDILQIEIKGITGYMGSYSSRLLTGNSIEYSRLENTLCNLFNKEAALIFNSGYHMNTGIIPAVSTESTIILADKLVHASIIDGILLSKKPFERFKHNDINHLEKLIIKYSKKYNDIIIVVEGIYSMDGDKADLISLVDLKKKYPQIRLYLDEAHSIGVQGKHGLGLAEETNTIENIDFLVGTFGKALASMGGYLITDNITKRILIQKCRPLIFSTAIPPINVIFNNIVLSHIHTYDKERLRLIHISEYLRSRLQQVGIKSTSESNIIPIVLGSDSKAVSLSKLLQSEGFFALPVRPPSVPEGSARIRISLTSETINVDHLANVITGFISNNL